MHKGIAAQNRNTQNRYLQPGSHKITLNGVEQIIEFSDRPYRYVNTLSIDKLDNLWDKGKANDDFYLDNPNAGKYFVQ